MLYPRCAKICRVRGEICCSSLCDRQDIDSGSDCDESDEEAPTIEDAYLVEARRRKKDIRRTWHRYTMYLTLRP